MPFDPVKIEAVDVVAQRILDMRQFGQPFTMIAQVGIRGIFFGLVIIPVFQ